MKTSPVLVLLITVCLGAARPVSSDTISSEKLRFSAETVVSGMKAPWGMAALPDNGMLITERGGTLRLLQADGSLHPDPVEGCLLYTSPSPRDKRQSRMPSSA